MSRSNPSPPFPDNNPKFILPFDATELRELYRILALIFAVGRVIRTKQKTLAKKLQKLTLIVKEIVERQ
jgi:hypothetical protein